VEGIVKESSVRLQKKYSLSSFLLSLFAPLDPERKKNL
jgi:hypothetical protein